MLPRPTPKATLNRAPDGPYRLAKARAELRTSTVDAVAALREDYANRGARGNRSQYRLAVQLATDGDSVGDAMTVHCDPEPPSLEAVYLVP